MKIPIFEAYIDLEDMEGGLTCISIVSDPAMEKGMLVFNKDKKPMMFKVEDEMQHCITSVVIRADFPVYRYSADIGEYYIRFSKDLIKQLTEKYSKDGLLNQVSVQHNGVLLEDITMVQYFIKDVENGISPKGFEDIEDGSLFATFKINNDEVWQQIMAGEYGGLSMELCCDIKPTEEYIEETEEEYTDEEFANWLDELLKALEEADCEVLMESDKKKDEFELEEDDDEDGFWHLNFDTDNLELMFDVSRADISKLIGKSAKIDSVDYWVYGIGKDKGKDAAILYNPDKEKYILKPLSSIRELTPLKANVGTFPPLPKEVIDNDEITVQKTIISNDIPSIMHSHILAQLSYDDELPNPHTGSRQVAIVAYGLTKAGNHCFRAYELFGDSRSAAEEPLPSWRLFLTKRVRSLKAMNGTEPFTMEWLSSISPAYNWEGDRSMEPCVDHITIENFIN